MPLSVLVLLGALASGAARAEPVDRLLYTVLDRIVTQADVDFDADLDPHDACPIPALEAPDYPREQRLVDITIVRALAGDTVTYRPTPDEVEARWEAVRASWARAEDFEAFLRRWGLDGDGLRGLLYSRMVAERYIRRVAGTTDAPADTAAFTPVYQAWIGTIRAQTLIRKAP